MAQSGKPAAKPDGGTPLWDSWPAAALSLACTAIFTVAAIAAGARIWGIGA